MAGSRVHNPPAVQVITAQQAAWVPTGAVAEVGNGRATAFGNQAVLTSGVLRLAGLLVLPRGRVCTTVTVVSGTQAAVAPTAQWFCLVRLSDLSVLKKTVDDAATAWAANTPKSLALASTYTPTADEAVYVGVNVVAGTVPSLIGWSLGTANIGAIVPVTGGNSTTGLTDPASLGATAAAVTGASQMFYGYVS